eukprot:1161591-Pelagomonas_calceolata.AAC.3
MAVKCFAPPAQDAAQASLSKIFITAFLAGGVQHTLPAANVIDPVPVFTLYQFTDPGSWVPCSMQALLRYRHQICGGVGASSKFLRACLHTFFHTCFQFVLTFLLFRWMVDALKSSSMQAE